MPRIHGGNNSQRGSRNSRRAAPSSSENEQAQSGATSINAVDSMDIDDLEEFSYEEASPNELFFNDAQQQQQQQRQRHPTKQKIFALEDTPSEDEKLPEAFYKSSKSSTSNTTRKLATKKKKSLKVSVDPKPKRLVPTVASPTITLSNISLKESIVRPPKNNSDNTSSSSKRSAYKKGPIGKPIKSASSGKKSRGNDENDDNDAELLAETRASLSRLKKGSTVATSSTKKKQQLNMSLTSSSKTNDEDEHKIGNRGSSQIDEVNNDDKVYTPPINKGRSSKVQVLPLRAIAIDNRTLPTFNADFTSRKSFFGLLPEFLEGMIEKGVLQPQQHDSNFDEGASIIASLVHGSESSQMEHEENVNGKGIGARFQQSVVPRASYILEEMSGRRLVTMEERNEWLSAFLKPVNHGLEDASRNDDELVTGFGAEDSWNYFGDLVEAIEEKLSHSIVKSNRTTPPKHPYSITLFTTDATFFAECNSSSHIKGLEKFWKRISPSFQSNAIATVTIVIVGTKSGMDEEVSSDNFYLSIQCINQIRRHISKLSQSMNASSEWIFDEWNGTTLMNLQLEYIEGTNISFQSLAQKLVQDSFYETYSSNVHGKLIFDLPETIDGVMCSITLDLQYNILPHSIHSSETMGLVNDMKRISSMTSSNVKVLQSIPISNVDSSMIYGVPMSARAGIDDDVSRYNEMKRLVRQMWKFLSSNEIGLVLRVSFDHSPYGKEELYLLMCEEALEKSNSPIDSKCGRSESLGVKLAKKTSCQGMLFRYAAKRQLLRFVNEDELEENENSAEELQYQDYIERSIEMLASTGLNPLLLEDRIL